MAPADDVSNLPQTPSTIPYIHCSGSAHEIGKTHGSHAKEQIKRSIAFYTDFFLKTAGLTWTEAEAFAVQFRPLLENKFPELWREILGVAEGAGVSVQSVLALNVRTEIAYGAFSEDREVGESDGCTSVAFFSGHDGLGGLGQAGNGGTEDMRSHHGQGYVKTSSWLAQNWDWRDEQAENLVVLDIQFPDDNNKPRIKMVTEAGIIGKIGFNGSGVGVCLNAIRARGFDANKLPVHLGLRVVLESRDRVEAERRLLEAGIASACTMVMADGVHGAVAIEWSSKGHRKIEMDENGRVLHTNHYLLPPAEGIVDTVDPRDTLNRFSRIKELADGVFEKDEGGKVTFETVQAMLSDEVGFPASICRKKGGEQSLGSSIFNIVMDLSGKEAVVTLGRLVEPIEKFRLAFTDSS